MVTAIEVIVVVGGYICVNAKYTADKTNIKAYLLQ